MTLTLTWTLTLSVLPTLCVTCAAADQGVYVFPTLTLMGYDTKEPEIRKIAQLGYKVLPYSPRSSVSR
jgi:hypothetical protein